MEGSKMRTLVVIALLVAPLPAIGQTFEVGPGGVQVYPHGGGGGCRELRAACMHKRELGESARATAPAIERCAGARAATIILIIGTR